MNNLSLKHTITVDEISNTLLSFCEKIESGWSSISPWEQPLFVYKSTKDIVLPKGEVFNYITIEQLLKNYEEHLLGKFTPSLVTYCYEYEYICYYPKLEEILCNARYIVFDNSSIAKCVQINEPYLFSSIFFGLLGEYIVMKINQKCLYLTEYCLQFDIPYIKCSTEIKLIHNSIDFFEWIQVYNNVVEENQPGCASTRGYLAIAEQGIASFVLSAQWVGFDDELNKLPLFVNVKQIEYDWEKDTGSPRIVERKMRVSIDDDYKIRIHCSLETLCQVYYEEVANAINEIHITMPQKKYYCVYEELRDKVQFLIDNKYEGSRWTFKRILERNEVEKMVLDANHLNDNIIVGKELMQSDFFTLVEVF